MKKEKSKKGEWISFFTPIIIALLLSVFLRSTVVCTVKVPTGSMLDTIQLKDRLIVNMLAYKNNDVERYDIVVFYAPDEYLQGEKLRYVKRVIGLPGETVEIKSGEVYVTKTDGERIKLKSDFVKNEYWDNKDYGPFEVPENSYFMMGDHRNDSWDARFWEHKYVDKSTIIGKAVCRYFPHPAKLN